MFHIRICDLTDGKSSGRHAGHDPGVETKPNRPTTALFTPIYVYVGSLFHPHTVIFIYVDLHSIQVEIYVFEGFLKGRVFQKTSADFVFFEFNMIMFYLLDVLFI